MDLATRQQLEELIASASMSLFEAYAVRACVTESPDGRPRALDAVGVVGFASMTMRGTVVLGAKRVVLQALLPKRSPDAATIEELICEVTNQLTGRFKNSLVPFGLELELSTPFGLAGPSAAFAFESETSVHVALSTDLGYADIWLNASVDARQQWIRSGTHALAEGEAELF